MIDTMYRNLVEFSCMRNNDEHVVYTEDQLDYDERVPFRDYWRSRPHIGQPRLVISRPVLDREIEQGLNTEWEGPTFDESAPEITVALDDFHKLRRDLDLKLKHGIELEQAVNSAIAYSFYDCMSGGAGRYYLAACRWFIEHHEMDLDAEVYPRMSGDGEDEWVTFDDFLKDIEGIPRIEGHLLPPNLIDE